MLRSPAWNRDSVRDDVRDYVVEAIGDPAGVLVADAIAFVTGDTRPAGVEPQYIGAADTPENCQVGTFLCYATSRGQALIDRELYLPSSWTCDRRRCRSAAIPDEVGFATKAEQTRAMLDRAVDAGVPFAWVAAPEVHGQDPGLRGWLEERDIFYVVATRCDDTVPYGLDAATRVDRLIGRVRPEAAWRPMPCGDDATGPHSYEWVRMPMRNAFGRGRKGWVLARRSPTDPGDIAYYMCRCPRSTPLAELVRVANACSAVEESVQNANEVGLDDYQVVRYDAWYAHITLAMAAAAFVVAVHAGNAAPGRHR